MKTRLLLQSLCGALVGLLAGCILSAIAAPNFDNLPLSLAQAESLGKIARAAGVLSEVARFGVPLMLAALTGFWVLAARSLNPAFPAFPFSAAKRPGLAWLAVLMSGAALVAGFSSWYSSGLISWGGAYESGWRDHLLALALSAAGGGLAWQLIAPRGWAGDLSEWKGPAAIFRGQAKTWALGAAFGAALCLGAASAEKIFTFLFSLNIEVWNASSEIDYRAFLTNVAILTGLGAACFGVAGGLAAALSPALADAERMKAARPALIAAAIVGAALVALHRRAVSNHQWRAGSLAAAASLPDADGAPMTIVTLGFDKLPLAYAKDAPLTVSASGWTTSGHIAASEANAAALAAWLGGETGKASRWRVMATDAVPAVWSALWEPARAFSSYRALAGEDKMSLLGTMQERAWLARAAPITAENRARLAHLSDESAFRVPDKHAGNLAKAWLRFGGMAEARKWHARMPEKDAIKLPASAPRAGGKVRGRITVKGKPAAGARAALLEVEPSRKSFEGIDAGRQNLVRLAGSRVLGKDGSFAFSDLSQGRWVLAVMLPKAALDSRRGVQAKGHKGWVTLGASMSADLGTIDLSPR